MQEVLTGKSKPHEGTLRRLATEREIAMAVKSVIDEATLDRRDRDKCPHLDFTNRRGPSVAVPDDRFLSRDCR